MSSTQEDVGPKLQSTCFVTLNYHQRVRYTGLDDIQGRTRFPFIDTRQIRDVQGAKLRFHEAQKHGDPVMVGDRPWETGVSVYGTVLHDGRRFRMWYESSGPDTTGNPYEIGYAESTDGVHWDKPELGVVEMKGSKKNNRVKLRGHSPGVIDLGPDASPDKHYLGIATGRPSNLGVPELLADNRTKALSSYWAWYSPDGFDWTVYPVPDCAVLPGMADTASFAGDPWRGRVYGAVKVEPRVGLYDRRSVTATTAPMNDVLNWEHPRLSLYPDEQDDRMAQERGCRFVEFYGLGLFPTREMIIGFPEVFWVEGDLHPSQGPGIRLGYHGKSDIQMVYSYDGYAWHRTTDREPFIPLGKEGEWDDGFHTIRSTIIEVGDEVFLYYYYGGRRGGHSVQTEWNTSKIGLAKIKRDRFASIAADGEGMVEVYHGKPIGRELVVNARTAGDGALRVEAREFKDKQSGPIAGFESFQCNPINGDGVRLSVKWGGKGWSDLPRDQQLVLRFYLKDAEIFAYEINV